MKKSKTLKRIGNATAKNKNSSNMTKRDNSECIQIKNLTLKVKNKKILDNISFDLKGKTAIIGPNGSGKTMTLCTISQLIKPESGVISYSNMPDVNQLKDERFKEDIGVMVQQGYFDMESTVLHELSLMQELKNDKSDLKKLIAKYEIENIRIKNLPHGKFITLLILQAMLGNPKLLILDEPFSGLDIIHKKVIEKMLIEYKGMIILSSHLLDLAKNICDNVIFIKEGKVIGIKKMKDIKDLDKYYIRLYS